MLAWLVLDYVCDGVYIVDVAVRLHTGTEKHIWQTSFESLSWKVVSKLFSMT